MATRCRARKRPGRAAVWLAAAFACGCARSETDAAKAEPNASAAEEVAAPAATSAVASESMAPPPHEPRLGILGYATTVFAKPSTGSDKLGYLRVGAIVPRSAEPVGTRGCKGGWYEIAPKGFVCAGEEATTDVDDPLLRAASRRANRDKPLPYRYGFVRSVLPLYLRVPTSQQQFKSEFKLKDHLEWFKEHRDEVQTAGLGALDLAVDPVGRVLPNKRLGELGREKNSTELSLGELFGASGDDDPWPFWLRDGARLIPNVSGFDVPEYAVFADRARRHTGLAFVGAFQTNEHHLRRRFAVTTDLRLAPTTKVKPDSASPWHGVELGGEMSLPLGIISRRGAQAYRISGNIAEATGDIGRREAHKLAGKVARVDGEKYYQLSDGRWVRASEIGIAVAPRKWPDVARKGEKWIEIDLSEQTLVLWEAQTPVFVTLISTGRPAIGDPETTTATPRGVFRIYAKHLSATMDSDEGAHERMGDKKVGDDGYVPSKGDGVYGKSLRRGHGLFKLRDVPYIQYFEKNYALHGAYWHDVFGIARSHGCVNLAPADALRVFKFTANPVPEHWHGVNVGAGTAVVIHK